MTINLSTEFPVNDTLCYLNHAAVAPLSQSTARAIGQFAEEACRVGAQQYVKWLNEEKRLRTLLKALINARSEREIGLVKNTSEGLSFIANGISWEAGDEVIITNQEFPSNRIVWEALKDQGVKLVVADVSDYAKAAEQVVNCMTPQTRLVSVSSVQYATGLKLDLATIGEACQKNDILFCVDAIQSLGALPLDCQEIAADFVVADGHKWMLGPEGLGLLYVRQEKLDSLSVHQHGWHMVHDKGNYDKQEWEIARDATKFECGSPNMLGIHGLAASVSQLLEFGINKIAKKILDKGDFLIEGLSGIPGCELVSPTDKHLRSGIVSFRFPHMDSAMLWRKLMDNRIICAHRGGAVRFSPHFHTPEVRLAEAIKAVASMV